LSALSINLTCQISWRKTLLSKEVLALTAENSLYDMAFLLGHTYCYICCLLELESDTEGLINGCQFIEKLIKINPSTIGLIEVGSCW
jgi:hypothetical protein